MPDAMATDAPDALHRRGRASLARALLVSANKSRLISPHNKCKTKANGTQIYIIVANENIK